MNQWHPLFAELLRPLVEGYYEVETNVPVGDLPRQADIVLLRRTGTGELPFQGLWRHLTTWNVLEFKGPSARPRRQHLEQLLEVGLGIARRLNEERKQRGERRLQPAGISLWYLADTPGPRFLQFARHGLARFQEVEAGVWRAEVLGYPIFIVRGEALPVNSDSLPFHLIAERPPNVESAMKDLLLAQRDLFDRYGQWLSVFHPVVWGEIEVMGKASLKGPVIDLRPMVKHLGMERVIQSLGVEQVIQQALQRNSAKR